MAATKRAQPATHPTVYVGLALAAVGLLLAIYAYTGTRIYEIRFALVALLGALLAVAGIFVSAWGRAIVASRAQRSRRALIREDALKAADTLAEAPPTVAAPPEKKRLDLTFGAGRMLKRGKKPALAEEERPADEPRAAKGAFAFKRRVAPPPPPAPPEETTRAVEAPAAGSAVAPPAPEPVPEEPPAAPEASAEPALERVTLRCPRCDTEFTAEGIRPFPIRCPSCGLAGTL